MIKGAASGLRAWGPVIVWMALMFALSTDLRSMANTSRLLEPLLRFLAVGDELHQSFVVSRGPSAGDLLIDAAGAALGLALAAAMRTRRVARSGD